MSTQSKKVLFFSPYAGVWQHALPEALVAAELRRAGAEIMYLTCDGLLAGGCMVMASQGVSPDSDAGTKERVCTKCRIQRDMIVNALGVESVSIESLVDDTTRAQIQQAVDTVSVQSMADYAVEGLPLGRYALHETIISFKLTDLTEVTPAAFADFKVNLRHVLMAFHATKRMLKLYKPERIVVYNTHYSTNYAMMNLSERHGVAVYGLHANSNMAKRLSGLYVFRRDMVVLYRDMIRRFEEALHEVPSDFAGIRNATDHFLALTSGGSLFIYSPPKRTSLFDLRGFFGVRPGQKLILATLSSYDELFSSQMMGVMDTYSLMFGTQVEWVSEVIAWAKNRPDVFLIIRVHPREFPNRRDPLHSNHARQLAATFKNLPENVKINWPTDNVSLYDLAVEVDVGLNGWSSAGKELSLLGIPVVLFTEDILYYPASLNLLAASKSDYFKRIDEALATGWSFERIRQMYRWLALEYTLATVDISDGVSFRENVRPSLLRRIYNRLARALDPFRSQRTDIRALERPLRNGYQFARAILDDTPVVAIQTQNRVSLSAAEEETLLRSEIGRIVNHAYTNDASGRTPLIGHLRGAASAHLQVPTGIK